MPLVKLSCCFSLHIDFTAENWSINILLRGLMNATEKILKGFWSEIVWKRGEVFPLYFMHMRNTHFTFFSRIFAAFHARCFVNGSLIWLWICKRIKYIVQRKFLFCGYTFKYSLVKNSLITLENNSPIYKNQNIYSNLYLSSRLSSQQSIYLAIYLCELW